MTQMSDLNNFLWDIQEIYNPGGHKNASYGESAFREVWHVFIHAIIPSLAFPLLHVRL